MTFKAIAAVSVLPTKALQLTAKAYGAIISALDPVMEVVFTIVPVFHALCATLELAAVALAKASDAFESVLESVLDPVMEVVFTVVPIFDVLEMAVVVASKLAVVLGAALCKVATLVGKAAAFVFEVVRKAAVAAAVATLKKIFGPVMWVYPILKFVFYTAPRYILSLVR